MVIKTFPPQTIILEEGTPLQYLYIVKSGRCVATKSFLDPKPLELKLGTFQELDIFGEDYLSYLLKTQNPDTEWPCKFTIKTLTSVTLGLISIHDAMKTFPLHTRLSSISSLASNPHDLKMLALQTINRKIYLAEKSKILNSLYREMYADPRVKRKNIHLFFK
jgi:CRP-like cAMP-binding protein